MLFRSPASFLPRSFVRKTMMHHKAKILHMDCMEYMARLPDKAFDLAIVDPPYGIGFDGDSTLGNNSSAKWKAPSKSDRYQLKHWHKERPGKLYFDELRRVSKAAIVWGGNYFTDFLPPSGGWVLWDKGVADGMSLSDAEMAWTNAANNVKQCKFLWSGFRKCEITERFHPTQKPVKLYEWLLTNYAKPGHRILDTHGGSMSLAIACNNLGFESVTCELDEDYYKSAVERVENARRQERMFV